MVTYTTLKNSSVPALDNEFVIVYLNNSNSLLIIEWKRQIHLAERKEAFLFGFELIQKHSIKLVMVDAQETFLLGEEEKNWLYEVWIDLLVHSSVLKLAVVYSENYNSLMTYTDFTDLSKEKYQEKGSILFEAFVDLDTAVYWLLQTETEI